MFHLKQLPKLVILDLAGNPVCFANEYRPYVLFTLRRVKVLDAVGVDAAEHAEARLRFAGRVTRDFLEVKISAAHTVLEESYAAAQKSCVEIFDSMDEFYLFATRKMQQV